MFLKSKTHGELVEILDMQNLHDPFQKEVSGRFHAGQEMQDPEMFLKSQLVFPSGEALPKCWIDSDYRHLMQKQSQTVLS
ncbi:MAG: acetyltransferase [Cyanobacteria bacterium P01_G01_bin.19]